MIMGISGMNPFSGYNAYNPVFNTYGADKTKPVENAAGAGEAKRAEEADDTKKGGRVDKEECQTCKNRKYVDGSNESDVSFKSPAHISPDSSAAVVMGHEQEHMSNAIAEGNKENKELVSASVSLQTSTCPECGRVYVSGGVTHTTIRTTIDNSASVNPYQKRQADLNYLMASGANLDLSA
jgi:hypothetical protein